MPDEVSEKPRILLVEDDEAVRQVEVRLLGKDGFDVISVDNGNQALERFRYEPFDLVLLDLDLKSEPNGLAICKEIKAQPKKNQVPVMFVTGEVRPDIVAEVFEAGAEEFIAKPFNADELLARVRFLVKRGREERWLFERAQVLAEKVAERDDELDDLRRFAQDIVGSLPLALYVLDATGSILYLNGPSLAQLGGERRDIIGRKLGEFLHESFWEGAFGEHFKRTVDTGEATRLRRIVNFFKHQNDRYTDVSMSAIEFAGVRQVLLAVEDVTDQAKADAVVKQERAKLDELVNAMNASLCLIDRDREIVWKNRTFDRWFGNPIGQPGKDTFKSNLQKFDSWPGSVFEEGEVQQFAWDVYTSHGQRKFYTNIIAPVKSEAGKATDQAMVLTQDVTQHATRVEQLSMLRELSQCLRHTLDAHRLNHVILLCVTAGHALGFNRAFLFRLNRASRTLDAELAIGPTSVDDAHRIWAELSQQGYTSLREHLKDLEKIPSRDDNPLYQQVRHLHYSLDDPNEVVARAAMEKKPQVVTDAEHDDRVSAAFRESMGANEFVLAPLIAKDKVVGVLLVDNLFSKHPISDEQVELLTLFSGQAALAIENADTYAELQVRMAELRSAQGKIVHAEKLAAVGKMAAHVAHEIRNPLSTIGGFARAILKRADQTERVERNAKVIVEETRRLENLLRDVMDFSRPTEPVLREDDLNAVAQKAFLTHSDVFESRNIQARMELDPDLKPFKFDANQMLQVLHNLIRNAMDAMPEGGALFLRTRAIDDMVELSLSDDGVGVPEDLVDRLFSPFVTTKADGTGLGLAVTKKIVDDHKGRIWCECNLNGGSCFSIELPLKQSVPCES